MHARRVGKEGPSVPEMGLGCWQLGGGWRDDWDDDVAQRTLETALAAVCREQVRSHVRSPY